MGLIHFLCGSKAVLEPLGCYLISIVPSFNSDSATFRIGRIGKDDDPPLTFTVSDLELKVNVDLADLVTARVKRELESVK